MNSAPPVKKTGSEKVAAYELELRKRKIRTVISFTVVLVFTLFFIMIVSGDLFDPILRFFGLHSISNEEGGVYADCSKAENRDNPYCEARMDKHEKNWENLTKGGGDAPFTLHR